MRMTVGNCKFKAEKWRLFRRKGEKQNENIREEKRTYKPHNVEIAFGNGRKARGNIKIYQKAILEKFERVRNYE